VAVQSTALRRALLFAALLAAAAAPAWAQPANEQSPEPNGLSAPQFDADKPIQVQADRLEVDNDAGVLRLEGNVVARQEDTTLNSDIVLIYYKNGEKPKDGGTAPARPQPAAPPAAPSNQAPGGGNVERLIAMGRVQITQGNRKATGERAEYDQTKNTITLTGDPVVTQGDNVLRGSVIVVNTTTKMVNVRSSRSERVDITIMPKSAQKTMDQQKKNAADKKAAAKDDSKNGGDSDPAAPAGSDAGDGTNPPPKN